MAAINGTEFFYSKPQEVLDVSIRGILNAIEVCKKNNIKNFIFASSSEVYQNPNLFPTPENVELKSLIFSTQDIHTEGANSFRS